MLWFGPPRPSTSCRHMLAKACTCHFKTQHCDSRRSAHFRPTSAFVPSSSLVRVRTVQLSTLTAPNRLFSLSCTWPGAIQVQTVVRDSQLSQMPFCLRRIGRFSYFDRLAVGSIFSPGSSTLPLTGFPGKRFQKLSGTRSKLQRLIDSTASRSLEPSLMG